MSDGTCSIDGCHASHHARGWCSRHYSTWRRTGDPLTEVHRHYASPAQAMTARTRRVGGCLIWQGSKSREGYGFISVGGRNEMAHRYAWVANNGPIPLGMEVDHVCGNRACCDPGHLRLASRFQNMRNRSGAMATSTTGIRNVMPDGKSYKVVVGGERVGTFRDLEEAREAAEVARLAKFGEFAGRG